MKLNRLVVLALIVGSTLFHVQRTAVAAGPTVLTGSLGDGATYRIDVPSPWNGTLVLYSHGYTVPGSPNPAYDAGDPITGGWLLANGYALAASSYSTTGWAVREALPDQIAVLDLFAQQVGRPQRTIAWGHSMGGLITALLAERYPTRFAGALPMCGVLAGGVGIWNVILDGAFAFKTLLAPSSALQVVHIADPTANLQLAEQILAAAQATPQGRVRLALVAALADVPGWYDPTAPEPAPSDVQAQEQNQFLWVQNVLAFFAFAARTDLEAREGGNPSWNTGVRYWAQLLRSSDLAEVVALYRQAHLSLAQDLRALQQAPRVSADPSAVASLSQTGDLTGQIAIPVLTLHTTGDGLVTVQNEQDYARVVRDASDSDLLRQVFVHRAGHCSFTPAETIAAFQGLIHRLDTGRWDSGDVPAALNAAAAALGPTFNVLLFSGPPASSVPAAPAFVPYQPSRFLRPYDGADNEIDSQAGGPVDTTWGGASQILVTGRQAVS